MYGRLRFIAKKCPGFWDRNKSVPVRHCSNVTPGKKFSGPGLKYFIAKSQRTQPATDEVVENLPYLTDEDLDGSGQKVYFEVQGCQMNMSDAEVVWSILKSRGYTRTDQLTSADIVLIVTCAIRDRTESKIWRRLTALKGIKKNRNLNYKVGILGCMAERLKEEVLEKERIVDLVAGPDSYRDLPRLLTLLKHDMKAVNVILSIDETYADVMPVRLSENSISAYVSIMRGCDNMCTYCIVPFTRGRERSRPVASILEEVKMLSDQGVKEITLLGQNVNSYRDTSSTDHYCLPSVSTDLCSEFKTVYKPKTGGLRFSSLLDKVSSVDPEMRIRFTSPHPKDFPDEVLHLIRERKNICHCIHLPAQSGSNVMLEKMRRGYTRETYIKLVNHIRSIIPDVALTTDMICGFCGETEQDHQDTLDLMKTVKYNFVFMFPFSLRQKTTAHRRYEDNLSWEEKNRRAAEVSQLFRSIAEKVNEEYIGQNQLVLIEGKSKKSEQDLVGRNDYNTRVIIPNIQISTDRRSQCKRAIKPGDYVCVKITNSTSQSLQGIPQYHTTLSDHDPVISNES
ncbi:UNVERIFIED_CONTAM: hypothetical protein PYX00_002662 [Menopon gallinae]|uniref:CDK5RAP1-like protein n=1 Tax=Menopon gallinae TaxID=328185 RepID=A0AAW2HXP0_9NEOP